MTILKAKKLIWLIFLIPIIFIFSSGRQYGNGMDNTFTFLPYYHEISNITLNHEVPYRLNGVLEGMDIYNIPQFSPSYPFLFLWLPVYGNYENAVTTVTIITLLHVLLCMVGSYLLFKHLTKSTALGLLGGLFLGLSGTYQSYFEQLPVLLPYCWIPITAYFLLRLMEPHNNSYRLDVLGLGFCAGMLVLSCFNHGMIHSIVLFICLAIAFIFQNYHSYSLEDFISVGKRLSASLLVFFLITGHYVYACISNMGNSVRWLGPFGVLDSASKIPFDAFNQDKLAPISLLNIFGQTHILTAHNSILCGLVVVFFFCYAVFYKPSRFTSVVFFFTSYLLISTLGDYTPLAWINYHIPAIDLIRLPSTHFAAVIFLLVFGAIIGIKKFVSDSKGFGVASIVLLGLFSIVLLNSNVFVQSWKILVAGLLIVASLLIKKYIVWKKNYLIFTCILLSWVVQNISPTQIVSNPISDRADINYVQADQVQERLASMDGMADYRVIISDSAANFFNRGYWANIGQWKNLNSFDTFMNPQPNYKNFLNVYFFNNDKNMGWYLDRGGKYVVCLDDCNLFNDKGYGLIAKVNKYIILANNKASKIYGIDSDNCTQSNIRKSFNSISFDYDCKTTSEFYYNTPFSANWSASIDNKPVSIKDGDARMDVELNPGSGTFSMKYEPAIYTFLFYIGLISMLLVPVAGLFHFYKKRYRYSDFVKIYNNNKYVQNIFEHEKTGQFARYLLIGGTSAVMEVLLLFVFVSYLHIWYLYAATASFIIMLVLSYLGQKYFTFHDYTKNHKRQLLIFIVVAIIGLLINTAFMFIFVSLIGLWYILASVITKLLVFIWNFVFNKRVTFKI